MMYKTRVEMHKSKRKGKIFDILTEIADVFIMVFEIIFFFWKR